MILTMTFEDRGKKLLLTFGMNGLLEENRKVIDPSNKRT
jgi:hypothetical protein